MPVKRIPEEYIQYIWRYSLFNSTGLQTILGEEVTILKPGILNYDSGPDFSNARVRIGRREWAGNVEIHFRSSDWDAHGHQSDPAYDSVILHVVLHHDREVKNSKGSILSTLSLSSHLSMDHFKGYEHFLKGESWVPCQAQTQEVDSIKWTALKERLAFERMELKAARIIELYDQKSQDWEAISYQLLARAFGGKVNSAPFEHLTQVLPLEVIRKHSDSDLVLEALFLGQAGFVDETLQTVVDYELKLIQEYTFLKHKYDLRPMNRVSWKHGRIHPASAPQVRIVQFARVWRQLGSLHSFILDEDMKNIKARFAVRLDDYWETHIGIQQFAGPKIRSVGDSLLDRILINLVAPIRFAYGSQHKRQSYIDSALSLLTDLPAEDNSIIRKWREYGVSAAHSLDSQGLLQLKTTMCDKKACLNCSIGQSLLR